MTVTKGGVVILTNPWDRRHGAPRRATQASDLLVQITSADTGVQGLSLDFL